MTLTFVISKDPAHLKNKVDPKVSLQHLWDKKNQTPNSSTYHHQNMTRYWYSKFFHYYPPHLKLSYFVKHVFKSSKLHKVKPELLQTNDVRTKDNIARFSGLYTWRAWFVRYCSSMALIDNQSLQGGSTSPPSLDKAGVATICTMKSFDNVICTHKEKQHEHKNNIIAISDLSQMVLKPTQTPKLPIEPASSHKILLSCHSCDNPSLVKLNIHQNWKLIKQGWVSLPPRERVATPFTRISGVLQIGRVRLHSLFITVYPTVCDTDIRLLFRHRTRSILLLNPPGNCELASGPELIMATENVKP